MKHIIIILLSFFSYSSSFANLHEDNKHIILQGEVVDKETKRPIPGVNIKVVGLRIGDITDKSGKYRILFKEKGSYQISFNIIGFEPVLLNLEIDKDIYEGVELSSKSIELGQINVTAEKFNSQSEVKNITILKSEDLHSSVGQTFAESLKNVPGVTLMQTGPSISKPVIRGMHSDRLVVVNNDVNQEGQQWGGEHAPEIDPFASNSIEIIKGASGLEFGPKAIGGVIRIKNSELSEIESDALNFHLAAFSNNRQLAGAIFYENKSTFIENLFLRANLSIRKAGDSKTPDYNIVNTAFEELSYSAEVAYKKSKNEVNFLYSHFGTELGIFKGAHVHNLIDLEKAINSNYPLIDGNFSYEINAPKQDISHDIFKLSTKYFTRLFDLEAIYSFQSNHRQEFDSHTRYSKEAINKPSIDLSLFTHTVDFKAKHYPGKEIVSILGINFVNQSNLKIGNVMIIPNYQSFTGGAYTIIKLIKKDFTLETGLRYDLIHTAAYRKVKNENLNYLFNYNSLTFSLGGNYQLNEELSISSYLGSAWRPPNLNELFSNDVHHGSARFEIGDLNLQSERNYSFDFTLNKQGDFLKMQLGLYSNYINNYIFLLPTNKPILTIRGAFPSFEYKQTNALISGLDGWLNYQPFKNYFAKLSFSYIIGENIKEDDPLIYMPPLSLSLLNHFHLGDFNNFNDNFIEIEGRYVGKQNRIPDNSDFMPPPSDYFLINVNFGTVIKMLERDIEFDFSINNILNRSYRDYMSRFRYFIDEPGINFILKVFVPIKF